MKFIDELPTTDPIRREREKTYPRLDIQYLRKSLQATNLSPGSRILFAFLAEDYDRWMEMQPAVEVAETKFVESGAQVQGKLI